MKGIREAALAKDEPEIKPKRFNFDEEYYDADYGYGKNYQKQGSLFGSKTISPDGQMMLKISVPFEKIKVNKDFTESCTESDFNKAEEYALKQINKFAGNNWEEKYSYSVEDCLELFDSIDLEIALIPN